MTDIKKILERLSPHDRDQLRKLAASPQALALVGKEIARSIAERQAERERQLAELEATEAAKQAAACAVITKFVESVKAVSDGIEAVNAKLDRIQQADRYRAVLAAANVSYWKNGSLHHSAERFRAALGVSNGSSSH
jgi:ubiquinone biosynthesis protein UbiJ